MTETTLNTTADTDAVHAVLGDVYAAWAAGDADAFAALYTEDATVTMRGMFYRGRAAVRDHMGLFCSIRGW